MSDFIWKDMNRGSRCFGAVLCNVDGQKEGRKRGGVPRKRILTSGDS